MVYQLSFHIESDRDPSDLLERLQDFIGDEFGEDADGGSACVVGLPYGGGPIEPAKA